MASAGYDRLEAEGKMTSEARKRATAKYDKTHTKQVMLKLNLVTDADVIERLDTVPNRQGYIKKLIREDIKKADG